MEQHEDTYGGPEHMRMIELALCDVHADHDWNCRRRAYTPDEIERAKRMFEEQPMLHAPSVAHLDDGRWWLVSGFLRFEVWRALAHETGVFRYVEGSMRDLAMLNFAENFGRKDLRPHELVARVADLIELGFSKKQIADRCGKSTRYVSQLAAIRRDAHPELWEAFCRSQDNDEDAGDLRPLTITRMFSLCVHEPDEQLRRWKESSELDAKADTEARGFAYEWLTPKHVRARKRMPSRRQVERVLHVMKAEPKLDAQFREGAMTVLQWLLYETDLGNVSLSLSTIASGVRAQPDARGDAPEQDIADDPDNPRAA